MIPGLEPPHPDTRRYDSAVLNNYLGIGLDAIIAHK